MLEDAPTLLGVPKITFVDDKDILLVVDDDARQIKVLVYEKCGRKYKKDIFYAKHVSICGMLFLLP